jgi:hypothetical protein
LREVRVDGAALLAVELAGEQAVQAQVGEAIPDRVGVRR